MHPKIAEQFQRNYQFLRDVVRDYAGPQVYGYKKPADLVKLIDKQSREMDALIDSIPDEELGLPG